MRGRLPSFLADAMGAIPAVWCWPNNDTRFGYRVFNT